VNRNPVSSPQAIETEKYRDIEIIRLNRKLSVFSFCCVIFFFMEVRNVICLYNE
jgi:hypothetical protein